MEGSRSKKLVMLALNSKQVQRTEIDKTHIGKFFFSLTIKNNKLFFQGTLNECGIVSSHVSSEIFRGMYYANELMPIPHPIR